MTNNSNHPNHSAFNAGERARAKGKIRVSSYYEEREIIDGRSVDVTAERDRFWYAGYDGLPEPISTEAEKAQAASAGPVTI